MTSLDNIDTKNLSDMKVEEKEFYDNIDYIGGYLKDESLDIMTGDSKLFQNDDIIQMYKFACQRLKLRDRIYNNIGFRSVFQNERDYKTYVKLISSPILEYRCLYRDILIQEYRTIVVFTPNNDNNNNNNIPKLNEDGLIISRTKPETTNYEYEVAQNNEFVGEKTDILYIKTNLSLQANAIIIEFLKDYLYQKIFDHDWIIRYLGYEHIYYSKSLDYLDRKPNLKMLDLSAKDLTALPLLNFPKLEILYLQNNLLEVLPENIFSNLPKLEMLYLSNNKLSDLPENLFSDLPNLKMLDLSNNKYMYRLPENIFSNLVNLKRLYLSNNNIDKLPKNIFLNLKNLEELDISYTHLQTFDSNTHLNGLTKFKNLIY